MPGGDADFVIPPALAAEIRAAAEDEHRPAADIVRDAFEFYHEARRFRSRSEDETARARVLGLPGDDVIVTEQYRQTIRLKITQGLENARQGDLMDGDAVFDRIKAELDELERQGHK
jgi:hypothetical protein